MRSNEERIELMHQRAAQFKKEENDKKIRIIQTSSFGFALAMAVLLALFMPGLTGFSVQGSVPVGMNASIFAQKETLGFIVIAILSFLLGVAVTIFCFYLKKLYREN